MSKNNSFGNGIAILGSGNVATHLAKALFNSGYKIKTIYSRTLESAKELALNVKSDFTNNLVQVPDDADLYVLALKDEILEYIVQHLKVRHGIVVHTAGSISIEIFENTFNNFGVFYPLQTFTKGRNIDFSNVPLCIEANNEQTKNKLFELARSLTNQADFIDSEKRKKIHLAAVFACNFSNHMYSVALHLLSEQDVDFKKLEPLIKETVNKAINLSPDKAQTGPALRNDKKVIDEHIEMLNNYPEFQKIYKLISESIYKINKK
ncbi:MAG: hypothetical protein A2X13_13215 [Bacteroidetes bacterium GWC2_33_15]|nr:MAG: hypothetical protein A2X10_15270 [Bacteroidetes bacterium GWA2_33_15]OFX50318.1 MAG: hypothetical protein A2X13_13215 [Bacteroidetes bacterium GWC2_33_15]OFX66765.1 MAG: hypothetical protein A2X15_08660 [Bacteroidetes bacterium GWB2_32_14]OFX69383.1 MAG: hypothetical protein A2X14_09590 [Bacteroidetes bacterium GWD2_33_33]HAN18705.1 DUF2520 domain-containing protein [Bacteroidales bacterium]